MIQNVSIPALFCSRLQYSFVRSDKIIVAHDGTECSMALLPLLEARAHRSRMTSDLKLPKEQLDQIRRERAQLAEQIRLSQQTIERSQELIRQMDEVLAKAEQES
jgi:hypothetical protein